LSLFDELFYRDKATLLERPGCAVLSLLKSPLSHEHSAHTTAPSFARSGRGLHSNHHASLPLSHTHTSTEWEKSASRALNPVTVQTWTELSEQ